MENYEKRVSEFNEAAFQIQRLHNIWLSSRMYREKGYLRDVVWILDSAEIELHSDRVKVDNEKKLGFEKKLKDINVKIQKELSRKDKVHLYYSLMDKEKILKEIQEESGKGGKYFDSADEGIDES